MTYIFVRLQKRRVYLSDYRIDIYTCRTSNSILVFSPTYIFVGLASTTLKILLWSNIYTVRLLLRIFCYSRYWWRFLRTRLWLRTIFWEIFIYIWILQIQSFELFLWNIHICLNTSGAEFFRGIFIYIWIFWVQRTCDNI